MFPPLAQMKIGHMAMVAWSAIAMPYCLTG